MPEQPTAPRTAGPATFGPVGPIEHERFVEQRSASYLQLPEWARVKPGWESEGLGWRDAEGTVIGTALVLYRKIPYIGRSLAYLPEGPVLPWDQVVQNPGPWLSPLLSHLKGKGAFSVRMGPIVRRRHWGTATAKAGLADPALTDFAQLPPDTDDPLGARVADLLARSGWRTLGSDGGFVAGQPDYVIQVPLVDRSLEQLRASLNQEWRRNITRAEKSGVKVRLGGREDLSTFHALYAETAGRDGFTPRPERYFHGMWDAFASGSSGQGDKPSRLRLYLAELDGEALASSLRVRVGDHVTYAYGASTGRRREVRASNAMQWRALTDAFAEGADVYDLRGIGSTLDTNSPLAGLLRFKLGFGGEVTQYVGEWEYTLSRAWQTALNTYLKHRP